MILPARKRNPFSFPSRQNYRGVQGNPKILGRHEVYKAPENGAFQVYKTRSELHDKFCQIVLCIEL
ncbi:MAG: hypothetical protein K0S33_3325 [Bacteroidetes bacterium]|jgi:hypothetical protein|nr:hypothetical protein [Bacteroidota bacterium]